MKKWNKDSATNTLSKNIADGKVVLIDGTLTLSKCSAADYLTNNHGYRQRVVVR